MPTQWNLWVWNGNQWYVHSAYRLQKDAEVAVSRWMQYPGAWEIVAAETPKDKYMRDNATVRHAPKNYLRIRPTEQPPEVPDKTADRSARGSYDT